jgi:hypothetical protein
VSGQSLDSFVHMVWGFLTFYTEMVKVDGFW